MQKPNDTWKGINWDAIGAIGEVVGAAAVVGSLLYLAGQVRMSARASAVESKMQSTTLLYTYIDSLINSPDLLDLQTRGIADIEALAKGDYVRFSNMSMKAFWMFSATYFQYRSGTIDEDAFFESRAVIRYWLPGRGCRMWSKRVGRATMSSIFAKFVDTQIDKMLPKLATGVSDQ